MARLRDDEPPDVGADTLTLYDSRFGKPRTTEWRAYYPSGGEAERVIWQAQRGELAVFGAAPGRPLTVLLPEQASQWERALVHLLELQGELPDDHLRLFPAPDGRAHLQAVRVLLADLESAVAGQRQPSLFDTEVTGSRQGELSLLPDDGVEVHEAASTYVAERVEDLEAWLDARLDLSAEAFVFPSTSTMAELARERAGTTGPSADDVLMDWLDAETKIFEALERIDAERRLADASELDEQMAVFKSLQNRRASRRGYSLEHHVARLLQDHGIAFETQVETEAGHVADFILPSLAAYVDVSFPVERLRHVAAKSTVRERWRQILEEARRIPTKHLVTVDNGISKNARDAMSAAGVVLVMPAVVAAPYDDGRITTVTNFLQIVQVA